MRRGMKIGVALSTVALWASANGAVLGSRVYAEQAATKVAPSAKQQKPEYLGSKQSKTYHLASCKYAKQITKDNLVKFRSPKEAEANGYAACKVCLSAKPSAQSTASQKSTAGSSKKTTPTTPSMPTSH